MIKSNKNAPKLILKQNAYILNRNVRYQNVTYKAF